MVSYSLVAIDDLVLEFPAERSSEQVSELLQLVVQVRLAITRLPELDNLSSLAHVIAQRDGSRSSCVQL